MECIHGLEGAQCDICFPAAKPEPQRAAPTARTRTASPVRAATRTPRLTAPVNITQQRIYHVTHLSNLDFIAEEAALLADAEPVVDISSASAREARRAITVDATGATVASHVPFFLTPDADAWLSIREHTPDPRLAVPEDVSSTEFVLLVSSIAAVGDFVFADGEAAHPLTRFHDGATDAGKRSVRTIVSDESRVGAAEVLVPGSVPFSAFALVAVANDRAKAAAKATLDAAGLSTRIAIHPPWFGR